MKRAIALQLLSILTLLGTLPLYAAEPSLEPKEAVLLLKNQQVLAGTATRLGDFYHLSLGNTGEIRIPKGDVVYQGTDLLDVYEFKVASLPARPLEGHLSLADWCIRQKLFPQAATQLVKAMAIKPKDPRIAQLEERLKVASEPVAEKKAVQENSAVTVGREQLERTAHELPTGALERFTVVVQPILMDRCGATRCHGSGSDTTFQIVQPTHSRIPSHRFTQRNLFATLALVNRENPSESVLLQKSLEAHGERKEAPFAKKEDRQYQELVDWIMTVSQNRLIKNERPKSVNMKQLAGPQRQIGTGDEALDPPPNLPAPPSKDNLPLKSAELPSRDPFDPAIFNERYFKN